MNKPQLYGADFTNKFKERTKSVSISVDSLQLDPHASFKVFLQLEPPSVKNLIDAVVENQDSFDLILAWHPTILEKCSNAKKFIFGTCWIDLDNYQSEKKDEISFLTSSKDWTDGHQLRQVIYHYLKNKKQINEFSVKSIQTPPRIPNKNEIFENAKFSIVVENESLPNWITEKLIDCFATKTVPIYWGCSNLGEYFDTEGVLQFSSFEELVMLINTLDSQAYEDRSSAIEHNYKESFKYHDLFARVDAELDLVL